MADERNGSRTVELNARIIGPPAPRLNMVRPRKLSDFPGVSQAHLHVARKLSSPLLGGPPICDELVAFIQHLFTEEEAEIVRQLGAFGGKTAAAIARAVHRPRNEVQPLLDRLAHQKRAIFAVGPEGKQKYKLMPIFPGIFEMTLIGESYETLSPWHRRFAELFEALYETGFFLDYRGTSKGAVRFLPLRRATEAHPMALPTDRLDIVLDRYDVFGVGQCQCRMTARVMGQGCDKPLSNCTAMGQGARDGIRHGWLKEVSRQGVLELKAEAEEHGLVNWLLNIENTKTQASCSCCGCCCHAMRVVREYNAPALIAPPHFVPQFDLTACSFCGKCARTCPMGAVTVDTGLKTHRWETARCIGCGLCALACDRQHAVKMEAVPDHRLPYKSWFSFLMRSTPARLATSWKVWRKYR
jgi:electron transport complex protein RnfB